jgi:hypothetical protein
MTNISYTFFVYTFTGELVPGLTFTDRSIRNEAISWTEYVEENADHVEPSDEDANFLKQLPSPQLHLGAPAFSTRPQGHVPTPYEDRLKDPYHYLYLFLPEDFIPKVVTATNLQLPNHDLSVDEMLQYMGVSMWIAQMAPENKTAAFKNHVIDLESVISPKRFSGISHALSCASDAVTDPVS